MCRFLQALEREPYACTVNVTGEYRSRSRRTRDGTRCTETFQHKRKKVTNYAPKILFQHPARRQVSRSRNQSSAQLSENDAKKEAKLCITGHAITENRNGLVLEAELTQASGTAEREAAIALVDRLREHDVPIKSLGADKGYFAAETINELRIRDIKPHIAPKKNSAVAGLAGRTIKSKGFKLSQLKRKLVEEVFGFMKTVAGLRKSRFIGVARTAYAFSFALGVYDLVRIAALCGPP